MNRIVSAIAEGLITPQEGEAMSNVLSAKNTMISMVDLERRVELMENMLAQQKSHEEPI
jgi:hypothetical protein